MSEHLDLELSAYLDGELAAAERAGVEAHLAGCAACREALDGLRRVTRRARALEDRPPAKDLWAGVAARIQSAPTSDVVPLDSRRRRVSFSVPQLAAAALALMALSGAGAALMLGRGAAPAGTGAPVAATSPATAALSQVASADTILRSYDAVIGELESAVSSRRGRLDTATVRVVEQSLRTIDLAIAQALDALARDPDNVYLNAHLQRSLDRKLRLLQRVAAMPVS